jgi:hypothetical protein
MVNQIIHLNKINHTKLIILGKIQNLSPSFPLSRVRGGCKESPSHSGEGFGERLSHKNKKGVSIRDTFKKILSDLLSL